MPSNLRLRNFLSNLIVHFRTYGKQEAVKVAARLKARPIHPGAMERYEELIGEQSAYFSQATTIPSWER